MKEILKLGKERKTKRLGREIKTETRKGLQIVLVLVLHAPSSEQERRLFLSVSFYSMIWLPAYNSLLSTSFEFVHIYIFQSHFFRLFSGETFCNFIIPLCFFSQLVLCLRFLNMFLLTIKLFPFFCHLQCFVSVSTVFVMFSFLSSLICLMIAAVFSLLFSSLLFIIFWL